MKFRRRVRTYHLTLVIGGTGRDVKVDGKNNCYFRQKDSSDRGETKKRKQKGNKGQRKGKR